MFYIESLVGLRTREGLFVYYYCDVYNSINGNSAVCELVYVKF